MIIRCKCLQCPFSAAGFCQRAESIEIDENGMCGVLWKHGQPRRLARSDKFDLYPHSKIIIEDVDEKDLKMIDEEKNTEVSVNE